MKRRTAVVTIILLSLVGWCGIGWLGIMLPKPTLVLILVVAILSLWVVVRELERDEEQ